MEILMVDSLSIFFFNDTATTEIYTLSLHDALPISCLRYGCRLSARIRGRLMDSTKAARIANPHARMPDARRADRKSTRLNSSHANISYAVFCLKKKKHKLVSGPYPARTHRIILSLT